MLQGNRVIVGRLTARLPGGGDVVPGGWKQRFGNGDLHPPGLPPASILLLRRVRSRYIADSDKSAYRLQVDWERQVKSELDELARKAVRPADGVLPAHAEAVLFRDEAELRACLVLGLLKGWARGRWWWQRFLRDVPVADSDAIVKVCTETPELLPAIVELLAQWGAATPFVQRLGGPQLGSLLTCIPAAFALPWPIPQPPGVEARAGSTASTDSPRGAAQANRYAVPTAPWSPGVERLAGDDFLLPQQALFIGLALSLYREPARVRTPAFGKALERWWEAIGAAPSITTRTESGEVGDAGKQVDAVADGADESTRPGQPAVVVSGPGGTRLSTNVRPTTGPSVHVTSPETSRELNGFKQSPGLQPPGVAPIPGSPEEPMPMVRSAQSAVTRKEGGVVYPGTGTAIGEDELDTRWGGIFYLVNLMQTLDLPGCWEEPWRLGSTLGPWGWLAAVARGMAPDESMTADPVYGVLLDLAGCQPGEPLGEGVPEAADYLLPAAWLSSREPAIRAAASDGRLLVWDEAGWMLADVTRSPGTVETQVQRLLRQMGLPSAWTAGSFDQAPVSDPLPGLGAGLNHLLQRSLPFLLAELRRRLGGGRGDVLQACLAKSARIQVSRTHIDLFFRLDTVDIATRSAGLDRDPGWLPDYGRVIAFHYS